MTSYQAHNGSLERREHDVQEVFGTIRMGPGLPYCAETETVAGVRSAPPAPLNLLQIFLTTIIWRHLPDYLTADFGTALKLHKFGRT